MLGGVDRKIRRGALDVAEVVLEYSGVLSQHLVDVVISAVVEQVQPCPVQANMLQTVTTEQGGSSTRDNEEVELMLLVLVRNWTVMTPRQRFSHLYTWRAAQKREGVAV